MTLGQRMLEADLDELDRAADTEARHLGFFAGCGAAAVSCAALFALVVDTWPSLEAALLGGAFFGCALPAAASGIAWRAARKVRPAVLDRIRKTYRMA